MTLNQFYHSELKKLGHNSINDYLEKHGSTNWAIIKNSSKELYKEKK